MDSDYKTRYWMSKDERYKLDYFMIRASDAGIKNAHGWAFTYFIIKEEYEEADRRLYMLYSNITTIHEVKEFLLKCNQMIERKTDLTKGMKEILCKLKEKGFEIIQNENGFYQLLKK